MSNAGEVSVELRLALDKLQADIKAAAAQMKTGLSAGAAGTAAATDKASQSMDKFEQKTRKATQALKDQKKAVVDAWRASLPAPNIIDATGPSKKGSGFEFGRTVQLSGQNLATTAAIKSAVQKARMPQFSNASVTNPHLAAFINQSLGIGAGQNRPGAANYGAFWQGRATPPVYPPPIPKSLPKGDMSAFMRNAGFGLLPASGNLSPLSLFASGRQNFKAFSTTQTGANLMGKVGLSGTGGAVAAAAAVTAAAAAIGVALLALRHAIRATSEAFEEGRRQYARQLTSGGLAGGFVAQRSALASVLGVSEQQVMQYGEAVRFLNARLAFSSEILARTAPNTAAAAFEIRILNENLKAMWATIAADLAPEVRRFASGLSEVVKMVINHKNLLVNAFKTLMDGIVSVILGPINSILLKLGIRAIQAAGSDSGPAPTAATSINRLQASAWEKMGLIVGTSAQANPAKETAKHTAAMVPLLQHIANNMMPRSGLPVFSPTQASP